MKVLNVGKFIPWNDEKGYYVRQKEYLEAQVAVGYSIDSSCSGRPEFKIGNQMFTIDYNVENEREGEFMCKMLENALNNLWQNQIDKDDKTV